MVRLPRYLGAFRVHDDQKTTAAHALGLDECTRLRKRVHGRDLSIGETVGRLKPYFLRHLLIHARHRFVDGLPVPRVPVWTVPSETWASCSGGGADAQRAVVGSIGSDYVSVPLPEAARVAC